MFRKISFGLVILFLVFSCPVFAGGYLGVGGDAEYFPQSWITGSIYMIPLLNYENAGANSIMGIGLTMTWWSDFSLSYMIGQQGNMQHGGFALRKKLYGDETTPLSLAVVLDMDNVYSDTTTNGTSYLGIVASKKVKDFYPYLGIFSSTYTSVVTVSNNKVQNSMSGMGLTGGVRYNFNDKWIGRVEGNYNSFSTTTQVVWPKSMLSFSTVVSYMF